ncbi:manganese efflux pump [Solibacillus sp. FSL K6-1523]|uniref:manganese efflux pump n=1 Tax=Solibacillus sp. FSL K6-1523 TaxID=2921471 RepID=UPI0030FB6DC9
MQEIITGVIMSFDVVALYLLTTNVRSKFLLALWTGALHAIFPLIGFYFGELLSGIFLDWTGRISSILLFFVGLQLLLSAKNNDVPVIPLYIVAILASFDTFSVSLSFGMLNLQKDVFIISAGVATFTLSYAALHFAQKSSILKSYIFKMAAGLLLIVLSVMLLEW